MLRIFFTRAGRISWIFPCDRTGDILLQFLHPAEIAGYFCCLRYKLKSKIISDE